jgi:uncharacterized iron-regulated protein
MKSATADFMPIWACPEAGYLIGIDIVKSFVPAACEAPHRRRRPEEQPVLIVRLLLSCLMTLALLGCAGVKKMPEPIVASIENLSEVFHRNQILDLDAGKAVSFSELTERLASFDVVFVGEVHSIPEHHLIQVQILQALATRVPSLTIGVEFFQQDQQALLDRYILGDGSEEAFLEEVDWRKTWGYPYHFYRPLFLAARREGIRVIALNASRGIVRKVAREGLEGLGEEERAAVPRDLDLGNEAHRAYVREVFERHDHGDLRNFEFFYEAQCVWDETMAHNIATFIDGHGGQMVVFSGNGHILWKFGIPDRTQRRLPLSVVTLIPYPLHEPVTVEKGMADYLWLTSP